MSIKTILVNADDADRFPRALTAAIGIAVHHQAHVIGVAIVERALVLPGGMPGTPDPITFDKHREASQAAAQRMQAMFDEATRDAHLSSEWVLEDAESDRELNFATRLATSADLIVASLPELHWDEHNPSRLTDYLMTETGRPILLVPRSTIHRAIGQRILLAWNGTREAARAAFDALPLLRSAVHITLLNVGEEPALREQGAKSLARVRQALLRHGVHARTEEIQVFRTGVGAALLAEVKAQNADLLVMGCYGHSRLSEFVLGGATRHVLEKASVPILMSH